MPKFLSPIDMTGLEVRNHKVHVVTADPGGTDASWEGRVIWNSSDKALRIHNGTSWQTLAIGAGYSDEQAQDAVAALFAAATHTGVTVTYNDAAGTLALAVTDSPTVAGQTPAQLRARSSHTGTQSMDTTTDSATRLAFTPAERTKLTGIAAGATANSTDAQLRDRATHTGTQPSSTISDFAAAVGTLVDAAVNGLIDSAPGTLDTLNELAAALGDDPNFATTVTNALNALDGRLDTLEAGAPGTTHKYAADIGGATAAVVTHNLNTTDVVVSVIEKSSGAMVETDWETTSVNSITVRFAVAPAAASHRVVVVG